MHLVYYTIVDNYMYKHVQDRKYCRYEIRWTIATSAFWRMFDVVDSRINERMDMSKELLGIFSAEGFTRWYIKYVGDGNPLWEVSGIVFCSWMPTLIGVVITLIDCVHQLFCYPNFSSIWSYF